MPSSGRLFLSPDLQIRLEWTFLSGIVASILNVYYVEATHPGLADVSFDLSRCEPTLDLCVLVMTFSCKESAMAT
ncbi:hypothetical protein scyTo_0004167 [Scyliorhinus torazame]|uniref:Uncharacterized protein n=1 Tax=Scyliorhinus torazame TaxID=75743 RepID=A0A401NM17_SCYTO|nr:hypothetical protein [Scyliorhinus torazame]